MSFLKLIDYKFVYLSNLCAFYFLYSLILFVNLEFYRNLNYVHISYSGTFQNPLISKWVEELKTHRQEAHKNMDIKSENVNNV